MAAAAMRCVGVKVGGAYGKIEDAFELANVRNRDRWGETTPL